MASRFAQYFGKSIPKGEADILFKKFVQLRDDTLEDVNALFGQNSQARRLYGGRKNPKGARPTIDVAFVFDRVSIQRLLDRIPVNDSGIIFFNAIRRKDDKDEEGRPTIIAFPFVYAPGENNTVKLVLQLSKNAVDNDSGEEHPGNEQLDMDKLDVTMQNGVPTEIPLDSVISFT